MENDTSYAEQHSRVCAEALKRLESTLGELCPALLLPFCDWARTLAGGQPADYFTHRHAFPTLGLPQWYEMSLKGKISDSVQSEIAFASICAHYAARLVSDVALGTSTARADLMPLANVLNRGAIRRYSGLFPPGNRFWAAFDRTWGAADCAAYATTKLAEVDAITFRTISSRTLAGSHIPLLALAELLTGRDLTLQWKRFLDLLCCWHELHRQLHEWQSDLAGGRCTWILSRSRPSGKQRLHHSGRSQVWNPVGHRSAGYVDDRAAPASDKHWNSRSACLPRRPIRDAAPSSHCNGRAVSPSGRS